MKNYSRSEIKSPVLGIRVLALVILLGIGSNAFGQRGNGQRPSIGDRFERSLKVLVDSVGIDEKQVAKVEVVNSKYEKEFTVLRDEMQESENRDEMREKFKSVMTKYDKEVTAILTDDQKVKYTKIKEARIKKMKKNHANEEGRPPRGGGNSSQRGPQ